MIWLARYVLPFGLVAAAVWVFHLRLIRRMSEVASQHIAEVIADRLDTRTQGGITEILAAIDALSAQMPASQRRLRDPRASGERKATPEDKT